MCVGVRLEALIKLALFSLHLSPLGSGFFPTTCLFIHNCIKTPEPSGVWLRTCEVSAAFRALMQSHALQHPTGHEREGGVGWGGGVWARRWRELTGDRPRNQLHAAGSEDASADSFHSEFAAT